MTSHDVIVLIWHVRTPQWLKYILLRLNIIIVFLFFQMLCRAIGILLHFFLTALFSWLLVEAWHLYALLVQTFTEQRKTDFRKRYYILGYGKQIRSKATLLSLLYEEPLTYRISAKIVTHSVTVPGQVSIS